MKICQPTLINYSDISQLYQYCSHSGTKIVLSQNCVIHTERIVCPQCGRLCSYNGSNKSGHIVSRSADSFFKKGQQYCKFCNRTYQVESPFIDSVKSDLDKFTLSNALSLREKFLSYGEISQHLDAVYGIAVSASTLRIICDKRLLDFNSLEFDYEIEDGFYGYDEQYITVNGKGMFRVVIFDLKNNQPIYESKHWSLTKNVLKEILRRVFKDNKPEGFVFDMRTMYPNAFKAVFGKKIKLQFCVFHLNKLILEEYCKALKVGKNVKWTLAHYYLLYTLFDIYYDRKQERKLLKKLQEERNGYRDKLAKVEDIDSFNKDISFPKKCKTREDKLAYLVGLYEKSLMREFREHLHKEKLRRKRDKETLKPRTKEEAQDNLDDIITSSYLYPKKIQERIQKIKKNFDLFTGSEGEVLTNNKLEGFFGVTLQKFRKKGFHSDKGLQNFFNFQKVKQIGIQIIEQFPIRRLANIFGIITAFT